MRGRTFSGSFSTAGSANRLSCRSIRQMSSGCLCSSAERPAWNGGSNQNQRSVGNAAVILTSAIRNWSSNTCPANSAPTICRSEDRAPSQAMTKCAFSRYGPSGVSIVSSHMVVALLERRHLVAPAQVDSRELADAIDQIGLGIELLQVDEGRPLVALLRQQVELIELRARRERSCRRSTPRPCRPCAGRCRAGPRIRASVLKSRSPASPRRSGRHRRAARRLGRAAPDRSPATAPPDPRRPRRPRVRRGSRPPDPDRDGGDSRTGFWSAPCGLNPVTSQGRCDPAKLVASATILNPGPGSASTQIGAIFAKGVFKRSGCRLARRERVEAKTPGWTSSGSCRSA